MIDKLTTENVRQLVLLTFGESERETVAPMFDVWLESVKAEAYKAGLESCEEEADDNMRHVGY
jgi:hypothetical protein